MCVYIYIYIHIEKRGFRALGLVLWGFRALGCGMKVLGFGVQGIRVVSSFARPKNLRA